MPEPLSIAAALKQATAALAAGASPRLDAEVLLAHLLGATRTGLFRAPDRLLDATVAARYEELLTARARGVPIAYLTGQAEFWSLELEVTPAVLVPRADTEVLVEVALALCPTAAPCVIADLGTGSGAIAAALARERPQADVLATDISASALVVAARNFARHGLGRIALVQGDWLAPLCGPALDVVVANPPYIGEEERAGLARELDFEPPGALFAGARGLNALDILITQAGRWLRGGAWLVVEHGHAQGAAVAARFAEQGFVSIATRLDLAGHARVTCGRRG